MKININPSVIIRFCAVLLVLSLAWYFSGLAFYIFLAFIFSLIGKPVARIISRTGHVPRWAASMLTILVMLLFFGLVLFFLVPVLKREAQAIAGINYDDLSKSLSYLLNNVQDFLYVHNLIDKQETLVGLITGEVATFASLANFSNLLGEVMSFAGSFFMGLFSVFFLTFFFIRDDIRLDGIARLLFGERHSGRLTAVSEKINNLLSRYFIGLMIEIAIMITLLYVGMAIFGVKGALLMAVFGGMLNAIPYIGPLIGVICSCLFGAVDCLSVNDYQAILPTALQIAGTFAAANLLDNIVLQPLIYSQSVKAHPVEIFLVVIMSGSLAGIVGMLFAIPAYTIMRTIVVELFNYANTKQS
jgi:predicted PurR-regulated permease PerM